MSVTKYKIKKYKFVEISTSSNVRINEKVMYVPYRKGKIIGFWHRLKNTIMDYSQEKVKRDVDFDNEADCESFIYLYHNNKPGKIEITTEKVIELENE